MCVYACMRVFLCAGHLARNRRPRGVVSFFFFCGTQIAGSDMCGGGVRFLFCEYVHPGAVLTLGIHTRCYFGGKGGCEGWMDDPASNHWFIQVAFGLCSPPHISMDDVLARAGGGVAGRSIWVISFVEIVAYRVRCNP